MKTTKIVSKAKNVIIPVMVGLLAMVTVLPVFAAQSYSYLDSVLSLSGYTNGAWFDGAGNNYRHDGYTYGSQYPGVPLSSVRAQVTSFDIKDGATTCNYRTSDSGNVYGFSVEQYTDYMHQYILAQVLSHMNITGLLITITAALTTQQPVSLDQSIILVLA